MKARWIILSLAGLVLVGAWASVAITYFFFDPTIVVWTGVVTVAAFDHLISDFSLTTS